MKKSHLALVLACTAALTSCGKLGELSADNFTVTPKPMEVMGGKIDVTINGRFPEKYMKKKAVVTVQPVLRYGGEFLDGQSATFQGESVQGNNQEISYNLGGNYTLRNSFTYTPEMLSSELYLTFKAKLGNKDVSIPDVKVDYGVLATSTLINQTALKATPELAQDKFQYAIKQTQKAQIKYLIGQANIRSSELNSTSVQDFVKTLKSIQADQKGLMLENVEVAAYASPDGSVKVNTALAQNREKTSKDYVNSQLKNASLDAEVDTKYTAEDWEGFQELVSQSNIQDKDVILRVLSMYEDPEEREQQIRNISAGYSELASTVLPELRRARLTLNYNVIGRSDSEIEEQYKSDASKLSVEELLYGATLSEDTATQKDYYTTATKLYPSDYRAYNNLAALAYNEGDLATAKSYLDKAASIDANAAEVNANKALIAIAEGNYTEANNNLAKATSAKNYNELLGNLQVAVGNYKQGATSLKGKNTNSAALAQILTKDYSSASKTLNAISSPDATTSYLKAILATRTNKTSQAISNLKDAISADSSLKKRAAQDIEFASLFNESDFQNLVK